MAQSEKSEINVVVGLFAHADMGTVTDVDKAELSAALRKSINEAAEQTLNQFSRLPYKGAPIVMFDMYIDGGSNVG
jgi:hypothetical protein